VLRVRARLGRLQDGVLALGPRLDGCGQPLLDLRQVGPSDTGRLALGCRAVLCRGGGLPFNEVLQVCRSTVLCAER